MIRGSQINLIVISQWCSVLAQPGGNKQNQVIGHFVCMLSALTLTFTTAPMTFSGWPGPSCCLAFLCVA